MVDENSKTANGNNQELHSETVMVPIIGGPEFPVDHVDCGIRTTYIDHLVKDTKPHIIQGTGKNRQPV